MNLKTLTTNYICYLKYFIIFMRNHYPYKIAKDRAFFIAFKL